MQCEFSQAELILLDLAVIERWDRARFVAPPESEASGDDKLLWQHIRKLETLHQRLDALIEQAQE